MKGKSLIRREIQVRLWPPLIKIVTQLSSARALSKKDYKASGEAPLIIYEQEGDGA